MWLLRFSLLRLPALQPAIRNRSIWTVIGVRAPLSRLCEKQLTALVHRLCRCSSCACRYNDMIRLCSEITLRSSEAQRPSPAGGVKGPDSPKESALNWRPSQAQGPARFASTAPRLSQAPTSAQPSARRVKDCDRFSLACWLPPLYRSPTQATHPALQSSAAFLPALCPCLGLLHGGILSVGVGGKRPD